MDSVRDCMPAALELLRCLLRISFSQVLCPREGAPGDHDGQELAAL